MNQESEPSGTARLTGSERFDLRGRHAGFDLLDFWRWSNSDLVDNTARGVLAEYIVARALGIPTTGVRVSWQAYDLQTSKGLKIEVKSAAFLQSWSDGRLSRVEFRVPKRLGWDPIRGFEPEPKRHADIYVLALLDHKEMATLKPWNLDQWGFYVLPTCTLEGWGTERTSIGLNTLKSKGCLRVTFDDLRSSVVRAVREHGLPPLE